VFPEARVSLVDKQAAPLQLLHQERRLSA